MFLSTLRKISRAEQITQHLKPLGLCGFVAMDRVKDLPTVNRDFLGRFHAKANLVPTDLHHHDCNVIVNDNTLVLLARQHKHD